MIDLAVGVLMGAAFGKIVSSLTTNLISPLIGLATGGANLGSKYITLRAGKTPDIVYKTAADAAKDGATIMTYGAFINDVITFVVTAFVIFLIVKAYNSLRKKEEAVPAAHPPEVILLTEIKDLLKEGMSTSPKA